MRFLGLEGGLGRGDLAGAAHLELVSGVVPLRPEDAMCEAMLSGWRAQQKARGLQEATIAPRERLVRAFVEFTNEYPWGWGPGHVEEWTLSLAGERHLAPSAIRGYQTDLRLFSEYLTDGRYGWAAAYEKAFGPGVHPVPICHEWSTIAHLNEYEGSPEARPFSREELQCFLDYADEQVDRAVAAKRKGALAAYRDATLFKVIYGWGLRRTETSKLDVADWGRNPAAPEFGRFGMLHVRYGKAVRGQPPRRRNVPSVMAWAVEACRLRGEHPAQVRVPGSPGPVGDRAGRAGQAGRDQRPVHRLPRRAGPARRPGPAQPAALVTHLTEDGVDRRFIQEAVGHRCDTSTAIYTHVSGDFMNTALRKALAPALGGQPG
jgi:integrase/recombinase XerC